jgi:heterodisulfide reductase subunit A
MLEAARHPKIHILSYAELKEFDGYIGNFKVKIEKKPRYVLTTGPTACTGCGACSDVCPVSYPNWFNQGFSPRKAIDIAFAQAVPTVYDINIDKCIKCYRCVDSCDVQSIDFSQEPEEVELDIGVVIVATGWDIYTSDQYGYGEYENVINQLELERLLAPNGPTIGHVVRPSDHKTPKNVVMIQCVGSRDCMHNEHCSAVCCLVAMKNAKLLKSEYPDANITICFIDIRAAGKDYEEYYRRAREAGIGFVKGKVARVEEDPLTKNLYCYVEDMAGDRHLTLEADMVVLSSAAIPTRGTDAVSDIMKLERGSSGFFREFHSRLDPISTKVPGIFIAGFASGPKAIEFSVSQGKGAASSANLLLEKGEYTIELIRAMVDLDRCSRCGECVDACPYNAISFDKDGNIVVSEVACRGCGTCAAICRSNSITLRYYRDYQFEDYIDALLTA